MAYRFENVIDLPRFNVWIKFPQYKLEVYMRKTQRCINGSDVSSYDIANIQVHENHQNRGNFKAFLAFMENLAKEHGRYLFVEQIHNEVLFNYLQRRGYHKQRDEIPNVDMYKAPNEL